MNYIAVIGSILGIINLCYLANKDNFLKYESEKEECIKTIKYVFEEIIKLVDQKGGDNQPSSVKATALSEIVSSLRYLHLIRDNGIEDELRCFSTLITDYYAGTINDEDFFGQYQTIIQKIYTSKQSLWRYVRRIFAK